MDCPVDGTVLQITERQGVEIDYCPKCRGVWLDRGELDKIIERFNGDDERDRFREERTRKPERRYDDDERFPRRGDKPHGKKRKSLLSELFEFGD